MTFGLKYYTICKQKFNIAEVFAMTQDKPRFDEDKILKEEQTLLDCYSGKKRGTISTLFRFYKGNYTRSDLTKFRIGTYGMEPVLVSSDTTGNDTWDIENLPDYVGGEDMKRLLELVTVILVVYLVGHPSQFGRCVDE